MLKIQGQSISLTRGDYAEITVSVTNNNDGSPHIFTDGERVVFRIGGAYKLEKDCVVNVGEDTCVLTLETEDTERFRFGTYKYEFEYINTNGKPDTFIANQNFEITPEQEAHNG